MSFTNRFFHLLVTMLVIVSSAGLAAIFSRPAVANLGSFEQLDPMACRRHRPTAGDQIPQAWHLKKLDIDLVHQIATGKGVKIAVIDTGVATQGTNYFDAYSLHSYNFLPLSGEEMQEGIDCDHGTAVASLIGADRLVDSRTNFSGIAPDSIIYAMRTISTNSPDQENDIGPVTEAVLAAISLDVDIINISQTTTTDDPGLAEAIHQGISAGIIVVAAAGNTGAVPPGSLTYPASYPGVISVGTTTADDSVDPTSYAATKQQVTIGAPGAKMTSLLPSFYAGMLGTEQVSYTTQAYAGVSDHPDSSPYSGGLTGTSFATPIVSGVVALLIQQHRDQVAAENLAKGRPPLTIEELKAADLSVVEVTERLVSTADPVVATVPDPSVGWGIVNPLRALTGASQPATGMASQTEKQSVIPPPVKPVADSKQTLTSLIIAATAMATVVGSVLGYLVMSLARKRKSISPSK